MPPTYCVRSWRDLFAIAKFLVTKCTHVVTDSVVADFADVLNVWRRFRLQLPVATALLTIINKASTSMQVSTEKLRRAIYRLDSLAFTRDNSAWPSLYAACVYVYVKFTVPSERRCINHLMGTLKPQSNGPLYSNTVTGRWWVGCNIWYSEEGPGRAAASPSSLLAVPNVTAHPSTASVPTSIFNYSCSCTIRG